MGLLDYLFGPPDIGRLKSKRDIKQLIKASHYTKDAQVRQAAIEAIGELKSPLAVPSLVTSLKDPAKAVKQSAAKALGEIGDLRAVEPLVEALEDISMLTKHDLWGGFQKNVALEALVNIGEGALNALARTAMTGTDVQKTYAVEILGRFQSPQVGPLLLSALRDQSPYVREKAAAGLVNAIDVTEEQAVQALISASDDTNPKVRKYIIYALEKSEDKRAIALMETSLQDIHDDVRGAAAWVLGGRHDVDRPQVLMSAMHDVSPHVRMTTALALRRIVDPGVVPLLIIALRDNELSVRKAASSSLRELGWHPTNISERAWLALSEEDFDEVYKLRDEVPIPWVFLHLPPQGGTEDALGLLEQHLKKKPESFLPEDLQVVSHLDDVYIQFSVDTGCGFRDTKLEKVDLGMLRQLARQELLHRAKRHNSATSKN